MKIDRESFIQKLDSCQPGLTSTDVSEQSSCFGFFKGMIYTYNEEILCSIPSPIDINGAVQSKELIDLLKKIPNEIVKIELGDGYLAIQSPKIKAGVAMESQMLMPIFNETIEKPGDWRELPENFSEAIKLVYQCCSKDANKIELSKIHIHPEYIEAADNYQGARYKTSIPIDEPCLTTRMACSHISQLGFTEISVTDNWLHFRNDTELVFSCRRLNADDYPEIGPFFTTKNTKQASFPKTLIATIERAAIFSQSRTDDNIITVKLFPGKVIIEGRSDRGFLKESQNISYTGKPMGFRVPPTLISSVLSEYQDYKIGELRLLVTRKNFRYVTTLLTNPES